MADGVPGYLMDEWTIEIWTSSGELVADVSQLATNRIISAGRNLPEVVTFRLPLQQFEALCSKINQHPREVIAPYKRDVRIRLNGEYLMGANIYETTISLGTDGQYVQVKADGFLNLFIKRYHTGSFNNTDAVDIMHGLINATQAKTNGNFGITRGTDQTATVNRDREYKNKKIKDAIVELTKLASGRFDFVFSHDRKLNTFAFQGRVTDVELRYPGDLLAMTLISSGVNLYNHVSAFGEGNLTSTSEDTNSQVDFGRHESVLTHNSIKRQDTLDEHAEADRDNHKELFNIPSVSVSSEQVKITDVWVGNRIKLTVGGHPILDDFVAVEYRIERISINLDDSNVGKINLTLDRPANNRPMPQDTDIAKEVLQISNETKDLKVAL